MDCEKCPVQEECKNLQKFYLEVLKDDIKEHPFLSKDGDKGEALTKRAKEMRQKRCPLTAKIEETIDEHFASLRDVMNRTPREAPEKKMVK